jgi:uncharacterized surface protein with fasciclin (FAS1) repeats
MRVSKLMLMVPAVLVLGGCLDGGPTATLAPADDASLNRGRAAAVATQTPTLVEVAIAVNEETGEFSTLIAAVVAAGLVDDLSANGQRTVFAPTDAAFAELGLDAGNIGALPVETLRSILLYHVTPGRREASSVVSATRIRMASGGFTQIRVENGAVLINDATIVATDVLAGNGIIHVIDGVLLP